MGKDKLVKIKYDPNDKRCQNLVGVDKLLDILETDEFKQEFAKFNERIGLPYNKEMLTSSKKNKAKDGNMKRAISGKTPKTRLRYSGTYKNKDGSTTVVKGYQVTTYDKGQSSTVEYTDDELEKYFGAGSGAIKVMTYNGKPIDPPKVMSNKNNDLSAYLESRYGKVDEKEAIEWLKSNKENRLVDAVIKILDSWVNGTIKTYAATRKLNSLGHKAAHIETLFSLASEAWDEELDVLKEAVRRLVEGFFNDKPRNSSIDPCLDYYKKLVKQGMDESRAERIARAKYKVPSSRSLESTNRYGARVWSKQRIWSRLEKISNGDFSYLKDKELEVYKLLLTPYSADGMERYDYLSDEVEGSACLGDIVVQSVEKGFECYWSMYADRIGAFIAFNRDDSIQEINQIKTFTLLDENKSNVALMRDFKSLFDEWVGNYYIWWVAKKTNPFYDSYVKL